MIDYRYYILSKEEKRHYYLVAFLLIFCMGMLFYRSILFSALCMPAAGFCEKYWTEKKAMVRRENLLEGFRDVLSTLSASVSAGRQLPEAIADAAEQAEISYGAAAPVTLELKHMTALYQDSHGSLEGMLVDFGVRSGLEEIRQFAGICQICSRRGGDIEEVASTSANLILDRIRFRRELQMLTAQKKLDIAFLVTMPVLILLFLNLTAPGYLNILYAGAAGRLIMTACLLTIVAALLWGMQMIKVTM